MKNEESEWVSGRDAFKMLGISTHTFYKNQKITVVEPPEKRILSSGRRLYNKKDVIRWARELQKDWGYFIEKDFSHL